METESGQLCGLDRRCKDRQQKILDNHKRAKLGAARRRELRDGQPTSNPRMQKGTPHGKSERGKMVKERKRKGRTGTRGGKDLLTWNSPREKDYGKGGKKTKRGNEPIGKAGERLL